MTTLEFLAGFYEKAVEVLKPIYLNIIAAFLILFAGIIVGKIFGKLVKKVLHEIELNKITHKATSLKLSIEEFTGGFVQYFVYFITVIMALNQLNVTTTVLSMVGGAVIILIVVSIILAIKDFIPNVFAGFYIYRNKFIKVGEIIKVKGMEGEVKEVNLFETRIETISGDTIYIPNSALTKTEEVKIKSEKIDKKDDKNDKKDKNKEQD